MEKKALKTPDPKVNYQTEVARDGSGSWQPFVRDWNIPRRDGTHPYDASLHLYDVRNAVCQVMGGKPLVIIIDNRRNRPFGID